jgi:putative copper export protein
VTHLLAGLSGTAPALTTLRLGLHVLAATVWVGGQIVMFGLLPVARSAGGDLPKQLARAFARMAWPAYALLVVTGLWNISTFTFAHQSAAWKAVLMVKIAVVALAGVATWLHGRATSRRSLAVWGSIAGTASIVALFMGVVLAGP